MIWRTKDRKKQTCDYEYDGFGRLTNANHRISGRFQVSFSYYQEDNGQGFVL